MLYGHDSQVHVRYKNRYGRERSYYASFEGVVPFVERRHAETDSDFSREKYEGYMREVPCPACGGTRLKPEVLAVTLGGKSIAEVSGLSIGERGEFLRGLELSERERMIAERVLKEVNARLGFLLDVGLDYLSLDRPAATLSGGEAQRIRLATQIGSGLVGVLYVLDEPSIGLHQRDNRRLIETLIRLRDLGNTLIVVEHDEDTIRVADWVVDIGPGAGEHGGQVVRVRHGRRPAGQRGLDHRGLPVGPPGDPGAGAAGGRAIPGRRAGRRGRPRAQPARHRRRLPARHLHRGHRRVRARASRRWSTTSSTRRWPTSSTAPGWCPAGTRGSRGVEHVDKVVRVDQSPIGRTPRSNPATYTGVFDHMRRLFAETTEAKIRGYQPGRFSFNVKGGRCEACAGDGTIKIEMNFLPDVYVPCEVCHGARYNRETLEVHFKGKTIAEVLDMPIEEAAEFFEAVPAISRHLKTLVDVGLGYVRLGQPAPTLSGGEAQRVKLASELQKRSTGRTVYVLDEPTTGLHFEDIRKLLGVLGRLVDKGNTVIVIEHNLDVIKTADWVVDMGPEGGSGGGMVVAEGTPEEVAAAAGSHTGGFLRDILGREGGGRATEEGGCGEEDAGRARRRSPPSPATPDNARPPHRGARRLRCGGRSSGEGRIGAAARRGRPHAGSASRAGRGRVRERRSRAGWRRDGAAGRGSRPCAGRAGRVGRRSGLRDRGGVALPCRVRSPRRHPMFAGRVGEGGAACGGRRSAAVRGSRAVRGDGWRERRTGSWAAAYPAATARSGPDTRRLGGAAAVASVPAEHAGDLGVQGRRRTARSPGGTTESVSARNSRSGPAGTLTTQGSEADRRVSVTCSSVRDICTCPAGRGAPTPAPPGAPAAGRQHRRAARPAAPPSARAAATGAAAGRRRRAPPRAGRRPTRSAAAPARAPATAGRRRGRSRS